MMSTPLAIAEIQADVGHLALDREEHEVAGAHIATVHRRKLGPLPCCRPRNGLAGLAVGVVHEATAIESCRARAAVAVRRPDLAQGNTSRLVAHGIRGHLRRCATAEGKHGSQN